MAALINPPGVPEAGASINRNRGRLQLFLILLVAIGPMVMATFMYEFNFWVPEGRSYHGELIANGQSRTELGVQADEVRWQMLVTSPGECATDCQHLVYLARQIQIGLGREASRASHGLAAPQPQGAEYEAKLAREYPQLQRYTLALDTYRAKVGDNPAPHLWIIDPHGNLVLRYGAEVNGKDLLNDLRQLLKLSNIG